MDSKLTVKNALDIIKRINFENLIFSKINKGSRGQLVEKLLGLPNSSKLIDLEDGELKTFTKGESIPVTQINHCLSEIIYESISYENSKVGQKLNQVLFLGFSRDNCFLGCNIINKNIDLNIYMKISEDYEFICNKIREVYYKKEQLNTINGPNSILQVRTKASKNKNTNEYTPLMFNGHKLKNKYMAFYLHPSFGKNIF
jgi:DNA mismatch repair protein MutH